MTGVKRQQQQQKGRRGPRTEAGRRAVSRNATRHGILSAELVIAALGESQEELDDLRERLWRAWEPQGLGEEIVAEQILVMYWRLRRVLVAEKGLLTQRQRATLDRLLAARRAPPAPATRNAGTRWGELAERWSRRRGRRRRWRRCSC